MLFIESINPIGMFSFGETNPVNFNFSGLIHLFGVNRDKGGSNGAGKSSLFNALCEVLFGENPTGVSGDGVVNRLWKKGFGGRVEFKVNDQKYRVTYCRKFKLSVYAQDNNNHTEYKGTALYFEQEISGVWVDKREASMQATRQAINAVLGMSYAQFLAVSYMSPRVGSVLLRGANKDKLEVLSGLVGLKDWDLILDNIRDKKRKVYTELQSLEQKKAYHAGQVLVLQGQVSQSGDLKIQQQQILEQRLSLDMLLVQAQASVDEAKVQYEKEQLRVVLLYESLRSNDAMARIGDEVSELERERWESERDRKQRESIALQPMESKVTSLNTEIKGLALEAARLDVGVTTYKRDTPLRGVERCPTCGSKITKASKAKLEKGLRDAEALHAVAKHSLAVKQTEYEEAVDALNLEKARLEEKSTNTVLELDVKIREKKGEHAEATIVHQAAMSEYEVERKGLEAAYQPVKLLGAELVRVQGEIQRLMVRLEGVESAIRALESVQASLDAQVGEVKKLKDDIERAEIESDHLAWFITNIPYIKLHKLAVALDDLSLLTNAYLSAMGDTVRVEISSFKEKKSKKKDDRRSLSDLLKSEISVKAIDGLKEIDPRLYSDGETARITNALVRGLHALASKSGQGCNLLLLDEVFSFVDSENSQKIAESFISYGQDHTVLVTDNSGLATNLINFSDTWHVEKYQGLSTLSFE